MTKRDTEHTRVDHASDNLEPELPLTAGPTLLTSTAPERMAATKVMCEACPILCHISVGRTGACDRWGNVDGVLTRLHPLTLVRQPASGGDPADPLELDENRSEPADSRSPHEFFVTGIGAGTTYPDYKPAPFIVGSRHAGVDMVTVVTEGIFSYCSFKIKIDTDRFLGPEQGNVRHRGEIVGHVTTAEYGSQMLSIGGVHHLTGGSRKEGRITCELMAALGNKEAVDLSIDGGASLIVQAGRPPVVDEVPESRMRVGCGSATIGIFAMQWFGLVDEVVVVDDHITGVLTEHQAGRCLGMRASGIEIKGRRSTPGRYFRVANPGSGWGGTDIVEPLSIIAGFDPATSWPGLRLLMISTTGDHAAYFVLDDALRPQPTPLSPALQAVVQRVAENCEPALSTVLFVGGAGGSLRAGVTLSPIRLTRSIKDALVNVTCGGAPAYVWPGGGITVMVDVSRMPDNSFGTVPTPAIVAPIEFTMRLENYSALGGYTGSVVPMADLLALGNKRILLRDARTPWPIGMRALLG
jgi:6-hydroxynicotinate reductase